MVDRQAEVCRHFELDWAACEQGPEEMMRAEADYLILAGRGDIDHLRTLVPAPLEATDEVTIFMGSIKHTVRGGVTTWAHPFHEWGFGIKVRLTEPPYTEGMYEVQSYVDDDFALVFGREVWGYPKKLGIMEISPETSQDAESYEYALSRRGTKLVSASIENLQPIPDDEFPFNGLGHAVCFRQIPSPDSVAVEKQQLVFVAVEYFNPSGAKKGTGSVSFNDGPFDQMLTGPLTDLTAYFGRCEFSHHGIGNLVVDAKELARPIRLVRPVK
jgi:acetoacetate decarboxylase